VEVDGAGHALLPEQPVAVATQVVRFLHDVEA
jgi:pimeloyl-ACP methyl ester carboxylesterase